MKRWLKLAGSIAALALAAYAVFVLLDAETVETPEVERDAEGKPMGERQIAESKRERLAAYVRQGITPGGLPEGDDDEEEVEPPPPGTMGPIGPSEAREGFDYVMRRVEKLGRGKRKRLNQDEWRDTYRAANDAFSALSMHLDASDSGQAAELEEAHLRLVKALKRVRVKGGKFAPG